MQIQQKTALFLEIRWICQMDGMLSGQITGRVEESAGELYDE